MTTSTSPSSRLAPQLRSAARVAIALAAVSAVFLAGPANADVPVGWSDPAPVSGLDFLWIFVGAPVVLFLIVGFIAYVPGLIKGEKLSGGPMPTAAPSLRARAADQPAELTSGD